MMPVCAGYPPSRNPNPDDFDAVHAIRTVVVFAVEARYYQSYPRMKAPEELRREFSHIVNPLCYNFLWFCWNMLGGIPTVNLRIPGPIPVPDDILEAMSQQMINHRGPEYKELLYRNTDRLKQIFATTGEV